MQEVFEKNAYVLIFERTACISYNEKKEFPQGTGLVRTGKGE